MCNYLLVLPLTHMLLHEQTTCCSVREIVGQDHGDHGDPGTYRQSLNLPRRVVVEASFRHLNTVLKARKSS
jgi:nucleoside diphosphate kinase